MTQLQFEKKDHTGWITITNTPFNSLIHPQFCEEKQLVNFLNEPDLKSVVFQGSGKHFCSGADLSSLAELAKEPKLLKEALNKGKKLLEIIAEATIPVAALIHGSCLGGGLEIALSCHFRFAAQNAMFGFPESDHGLMPGMGGTIFSTDLIGKSNTIDLLLSGRMIRAEEALEKRLIDVVAPGKILEEKLNFFLTRLTEQHSPKLIRSVMKSIHNGRRLPIKKALAKETQLFCDLVQDNVDISLPDKS